MLSRKTLLRNCSIVSAYRRKLSFIPASAAEDKLYYNPTSCGAASFMAAYNAGVNLQCEQVNIKTHKLQSGADFYAINPKGNVPTIVLKNGVVLNENNSVLQYIADQAHGTLAPANGTIERAVLQNALSYISSEVHPSIGGLFNPNIGEETKEFLRGNAVTKLGYLESYLLADRQYVMGEDISIADAYLYVVLTWVPYVGLDLTPYPKLSAYVQRMKNSDFVKDAYKRMKSNPSTVL